MRIANVITSAGRSAAWLYGVFMLVVAWLQLGWAVAVLARFTPWVLWSGGFSMWA